LVTDCDRFWALAHEAIDMGLLTKEEALVIARVGTRKESYWARHLLDLKSILEYRSG